MKINPRTGTIQVGKPNRTKRVDHVPRKKMGPAKPSDDMLSLAERIGHIIGQKIVDALQSGPAVHVPSCWPADPNDVPPETTLTVTPVDKDDPYYIAMDETIIDVGIGKVDALKKGEGSATLAKQEIKEDSDLKKSKDKLSALKRSRD